jgi:hypothetical protein
LREVLDEKFPLVKIVYSIFDIFRVCDPKNKLCG